MNLKTTLKLTRLHRPVGIWLLLFPTWWGLGLASPTFPPLSLLLLFLCGAVLMRSAGCVYNDMIDKDFDLKVKRTALRPLATGDVTKKEAIGVFFLLLIGGGLVLVQLPFVAILTGIIALFLVLLYPWMKRWTYWPQVFLGITFNIGILVGWLALQPNLGFGPFLFYGGAILWTLGYDTIYAFQDHKDDLFIGIKSSAMVLSPAPKLSLSLIYGLTICLWGLGGKVAHLGTAYAFILGIISLHFAWQIFSLNEKVPSNCQKRFESNVIVGALLFVGIVFSHLID